MKHMGCMELDRYEFEPRLSLFTSSVALDLNLNSVFYRKEVAPTSKKFCDDKMKVNF